MKLKMKTNLRIAIEEKLVVKTDAFYLTLQIILRKKIWNILIKLYEDK